MSSLLNLPRKPRFQFRREDESVVRGAEIIRQRIRDIMKQREMEEQALLGDTFAMDASAHNDSCQSSYYSEDNILYGDPWRELCVVEPQGTETLKRESASKHSPRRVDQLVFDIPKVCLPSSLQKDVDHHDFEGSLVSFSAASAAHWSNRPPSPPIPSRDGADTPITFMGRDNRIRMKTVTYMVQPIVDCYESSTDGSDQVSGQYREETGDDIHTMDDNRDPLYLPINLYAPTPLRKNVQRFEPIAEPSLIEQRDMPPPTNVENPMKPTPIQKSPDVSCCSPSTMDRIKLGKDPAYQHAQRAGYLWQSLVGQHVRFPKIWFNGERGPALGCPDNKWHYHGNILVDEEPFLKIVVRNRAAPGRILLHIVVQELVSWQAILDIVVGCYHPNARGVRSSAQPNAHQEHLREVWLACRHRCSQESVVDNLLGEYITTRGPLGEDRRVTNLNMRALFGEMPPLETVYVSESDLYELLSSRTQYEPSALTLLERYVFS